MKQYIAIFEIDETEETVVDIQGTVDYTYRKNGTCYRHTEAIDFAEVTDIIFRRIKKHDKDRRTQSKSSM